MLVFFVVVTLVKIIWLEMIGLKIRENSRSVVSELVGRSGEQDKR